MTIMKKVKLISVTLLSLIVFACSPIPNKSVFEPLDSKELAKVLKAKPNFEKLYTSLKNCSVSFNEIEKAKFSDITWRELYKAYELGADTTKTALWKSEWKERFSGDEEKVDSVLNYWQKYKEKNSLSRYVKVEFAELYKEYYSYDYEVKNVHFGFKLTPLQGKVEQVKFTYRFSAKINDNVYGASHSCITTTPFSSSVVRYWEADYSDENTLKNMSTSSFIRDYDMKIEVTNVRKDGKNYSIDDLYIPKSVTEYWDNSLDFMEEDYRAGIIKSQINSAYKREYEYLTEQSDSLFKSKFPRVFEFYSLLKSK